MKKWILAGLAAAILILAAVFVLLPVKTIRFDGESVYTEEELKTLIFGTDAPKYYVARLRELFKNHGEIPFLARYDLIFGEDRSIDVHLYEKSLAGYIRFQNYYLYFDWDGTLVEIGTKRLEDLYEVRGLSVEHAVKGETLPVSDSGTLHTILTLTQFLNRETIRVDGKERRLGSLCEGIRFKNGDVQLEFGGLSVYLGGSEHMEGKLYAMLDILPELEGRRGILYLDSYQAGAPGQNYIFKEN